MNELYLVLPEEIMDIFGFDSVMVERSNESSSGYYIHLIDGLNKHSEVFEPNKYNELRFYINGYIVSLYFGYHLVNIEVNKYASNGDVLTTEFSSEKWYNEIRSLWRGNND